MMMATITVKNIPDDIYEKLKETAKENHRSVNSEVILLIKMAVMRRPMDVAAVLEGARQTRELTAHYVITDEELTKFKNEGRSSLTELFPVVQSLPHADKLRLMQALAAELARDEGIPLMEDAADYPVWSPYNAFDAAATLLQALDEDQSK
ncbi:MAG: Arc family DNA-binding protein [Anaerolineales bacterium]